MTKFMIPAAFALSVFAFSGTGVVAPVGVANAHSNSCHTVTNYNKRYSCETHERRRAYTTPRPRRPVPPPTLIRDLRADPGGAGGGGGGGGQR